MDCKPSRQEFTPLEFRLQRQACSTIYSLSDARVQEFHAIYPQPTITVGWKGCPASPEGVLWRRPESDPLLPGRADLSR